MAHRVHLAAHLTETGPDPDLSKSHQAFALDGWAGALPSVWGASAVELDWRLAKISRRHGTLALRATTEDDYLFQLVILINGERSARLSHVYFASLDEALEILRDSLEIADLPADQPVESNRRQDVADLASQEPSHPWLLRVAAGESPREAFVNTGRLQAAEIAAIAEAAGLAGDVELLERFFTGNLTPAEMEAEEDWEHFGDLLLFIEALGLHGLKQHLEAEAASEDQEPQSEAEEESQHEAEAEADRAQDEQAGRRRKLGKRIAGAGCLLSIAAIAVGIRFGAELGGGWGVVAAILFFVLLLALASYWLWRRFVGKLKQAFGGDSLTAESAVPAKVLQKWRTLLFNWRDLVYRLGVAGSMRGRRPKVGIFDALYSDQGLPTDPAGRRLIDLMTTDPASLPELTTEVRTLRLALLDAEISGTDVAPQRATYGAICERLLADE